MQLQIIATFAIAKTKSDKVASAGKPDKMAEVKSISSVKEGAVTKPSQTPKAKSQEIAKVIATKADKVSKKSKKVVKEPTPEPSSDESEEEPETSDSSESSESEKEVAKPVAKTNGKVNGKMNGTAKAADKAQVESSDSSDSSDEEDTPAPQKAVVKEDSDSEDSEEDDESDESESDEEPKSKGPVDAKALNGKLEIVKSQEASDDDEDDSNDSDNSGSDKSSDSENDSADSDSDSSDESQDEAPPKKRKAEADAAPVAKKAKTEATNVTAEGVKNLFVGSLSWNVDEDWLTREFEGFGELSGVRIIMDKATGRSKGFGYVEYVNAEDAAKALSEMKGKTIDNREINLDFSTPRSDKKEGFQARSNDRAKTYGDEPSEPSDTLFVGNIAFEATEDIIGEEFGKHGTVTGVRLPTDMDTGNPKGFGYVQFASIDDATAAFDNMKGAAICGRPIRLDYGRARADNGDSPRRGGRGGGFGGGRGGRGGDRGGRGGGRGGRGGFGDRGGRGGSRGGSRGGRGGSTNRGGFGDFQGKKMTF